MNESKLKNRAIKNYFWSFSSAIISRAGSLILAIILARFLLPEGYGIYSIVLSVSMIFYTLADLGVNQALTRYISLGLAKNKKSISSYYAYLLKLKFYFSLASACLLLIFSYPIASIVFKNSQLFLPLLAATLYIFIMSFETFYIQIFYAVEKNKYLSLREIISQILRIGLVLAAIFLIMSDYKITSIFLSMALVSAILILYSRFYIKKILPELFYKERIKIDKKSINKFVWFLTIAGISTVFFSNIDSILLGLFLKPEYVGYYRASFSIVLGVIGLASVQNSLFLPIFTKIKKSEINKVLNKVFSYLAVLSIPATFGLIILGKYFLRLFYGYAYLDSYNSLFILSFLIFPAAATSLFLSLFSAEAKPNIFAKLILISCILNVCLNFALIKLFLTLSPVWATFGAGLATLISWLFYFFSCNYFIKKSFNIRINLLVIIKPIIAGLIMLCVLSYSLRFINNMTVLLGVLEVILGGAVYLISILLLGGLKKEDITMFRVLLSRSK